MLQMFTWYGSAYDESMPPMMTIVFKRPQSAQKYGGKNLPSMEFRAD